ncbi:MAG: DUF1565 domain-containing protein [Planctomycetes bacterium]|nr:DUF1565 domain-containing protein [Planctomycetota bacterium]
MKPNSFLVAAALLSVAAIPAQTVTHYWIDATNGNDANSGTQAQPFKSLTWALGTQANDLHIHVLPGVYSPTNTGDFFDAVANAPAQIRLRAYQNLRITGVDKATCILDFGAGNGPWGYFDIGAGCVDIEISDLTMRNAGLDPWGNGAIAINNGAQSVDIHNCYFEQTYSTLIVWGGFDVAFHDNVITDAVPNTGQWPSVGVRVRTTVSSGDRTYIFNNTFYAIGQGISWSNDANNPQQWIINNVVLGATGKGYPNSVYQGTHIVFEKNLAFNSTTWNYDPAIGPNGTAPLLSLTNLEVDPMLTNPVAGDYSPLAGSPCIESGSVISHPYAMNDYAGNNRAVDSDENGSAIPDRGAIETTDITLVVTNFGQGLTATIDPQTTTPGTWATGALFMSLDAAPAYYPWFGMFGPDPLSVAMLLGYPGVPYSITFPAFPGLDGIWVNMQFLGVKTIGSANVLKGTGMVKGLL